MGLDSNGLLALFHCRSQGVQMDSCITLGRQKIHIPMRKAIWQLQKTGLAEDRDCAVRLLSRQNFFAEPILEKLGARSIDSMDYSAYEGCTIVHDLNLPIPDELRNRYHLVFDSGTLEHVFNFPQALKNCMQMVREDGHLLILTPCNNFMGHGFYQFGPETFCSVLVPENGFEILSLFVYEDRPTPVWYEVSSPHSVQGRVTLCNSRQTYLLVLAKRFRIVDPLDVRPQQSDYVLTWSADGKIDPQRRGIGRLQWLNRIKSRLHTEWRTPLWRWIVRVVFRGYDPRFYRRVPAHEVWGWSMGQAR